MRQIAIVFLIKFLDSLTGYGVSGGWKADAPAQYRRIHETITNLMNRLPADTCAELIENRERHWGIRLTAPDR